MIGAEVVERGWQCMIVIPQHKSLTYNSQYYTVCVLHNVVGTVTMNMEQLAFTYLDTVSEDASGAFVSLLLLQNV